MVFTSTGVRKPEIENRDSLFFTIKILGITDGSLFSRVGARQYLTTFKLYKMFMAKKLKK